MPSFDQHFVHKAGWLRATVLGANDGLVSTASLIVGVAAAGAGKPEIIIAGIAGLVAGAMSMAAGEYVSVSSQSDIETADLEREIKSLEAHPENELQELAQIYMRRGVDEETAHRVALQMTEHDALGTHARDELGIHEHNAARPFQAAFASVLSFAIGAALPLLIAGMMSLGALIPGVVIATLFFLAMLGAIGARTGGAPIFLPTLRVLFWGAFAMAVTALVGMLIGAAI